MADERLETDSGRQRRLEYQEELDKVTAARHIRTEHFSSHVKLEGYYESPNPSYMFQCDRLMKAESMFGRLQLGYHPARRRSFLFVHLKSSRYDTVSGRTQRELKEYQLNSRLRSQSRAFAAKSRGESAGLIEKAGGRPWGEKVIRAQGRRMNAGALENAMPFLFRDKNRKRLAELRVEGRQLQDEIQLNVNEGRFQDNIILRQQQTQKHTEENFLNHLISCKEAASRNLLGTVSRVFENQKHEMFAYYKNRLKEERSEQETAADAGEDEADQAK